jgi:hypothetical protein
MLPLEKLRFTIWFLHFTDNSILYEYQFPAEFSKYIYVSKSSALKKKKKIPEFASPKTGGQVSNQKEVGDDQNTCLLPTDYLLGLFFPPYRWGQLCSSKMSVNFYWTTWCHIPEVSTLHFSQNFNRETSWTMFTAKCKMEKMDGTGSESCPVVDTCSSVVPSCSSITVLAANPLQF